MDRQTNGQTESIVMIALHKEMEWNHYLFLCSSIAIEITDYYERWEIIMKDGMSPRQHTANPNDPVTLKLGHDK